MARVQATQAVRGHSSALTVLSGRLGQSTAGPRLQLGRRLRPTPGGCAVARRVDHGGEGCVRRPTRLWDAALASARCAMPSDACSGLVPGSHGTRSALVEGASDDKMRVTQETGEWTTDLRGGL